MSFFFLVFVVDDDVNSISHEYRLGVGGGGGGSGQGVETARQVLGSKKLCRVFRVAPRVHAEDTAGSDLRFRPSETKAPSPQMSPRFPRFKISSLRNKSAVPANVASISQSPNRSGSRSGSGHVPGISRRRRRDIVFYATSRASKQTRRVL